MRSPVSVVVAEIVKQNIEESVLSTCRHTIYTALVATLTIQTFHASKSRTPFMAEKKNITETVDNENILR